jgi:phospholipid/cholesterol/gamma-HCH transport system substrate-binding protein
MKDQRKIGNSTVRRTEIKVGLMVILGLIVFFWILGWAKNFSLAENQKILEIKFDNVAGLEAGDYVTVNGVRKGYVDDFKVEAQDVIVRVTLDNDVDLRKDATFSISMLDLMGGKKIDIYPGSSQDPLNYNKIQNGIFNADISTVMSMVGGAREDLTQTLKGIKITLNGINKYLSDNELNNNLKNSLSNLAEITSKLNQIIDENRNNLKMLTENLTQLTDEAKEFVANNKISINESVESLKLILQKSDTLVANLNMIVDQTINKQNNVGNLMYDEQLYKNLKTTIRQLNELTNQLNEQLKNDGIKVDAHISFF